MADSDAHNGNCPQCGHSFTLAELKTMATGDGWQRFIPVALPDGTRAVVSFDARRPSKAFATGTHKSQ
jgi:hypothetical protein